MRVRDVAQAATGVGTGGKFHESHTYCDRGRLFDRRPARLGANHAAFLFVDDDVAKHDGDHAGHASAAVNHDLAKHHEHDVNAGRRFANNHNQHQHDDDARRVPHAQSGRRAVCLPLRSDQDWNLDRRRRKRPQYLRASNLKP
jgi:hypothetical protein